MFEQSTRKGRGSTSAINKRTHHTHKHTLAQTTLAQTHRHSDTDTQVAAIVVKPAASLRLANELA